MSALRLRALLQKEWRDMLRNKMVLLSVIIAPLILLSVSVFMLVLFNGSYEELARLNYADDFEREWAILFNNILMFFLIMPLVIPVSLAVYAVVGEKEQGSLEPLLATPLTDGELFMGKAVASVLPGLAVTWFCFGLFSMFLLFLMPGQAGLFFKPAWLLSLFALAPLLATFSVLTAMAISALTRDTRAAYQLSSLIILPFLVGGLSFVFTQPGLVSPVTVGMGMGLMALLDALMLWVCVRLFRRQDILTRWR